MNKRIMSFVVALAMCLSLNLYTAEPVWAAWEDRGDVTSIFQDVPAGAWYERK